MGDNCDRVHGTPDGPSPAKKRRVMHAPEGFETLRQITGRAQVPARKFTSAFDDPRRSKLTPKDSPLRIPRPHAPIPSMPIAGPSKESSLRVLRAPVLPVSNLAHAGPSNHASSVASGSRNTTPIHMGVPAFAPGPGASTKFTLKGSVISSPRKPVSKANLQKLQPPALPPLPEPVKFARNLNVMKPPPPPPPPLRKGPPLPDVSKLKTILTTRVAVAMDPRTESGTDELMALYLEQNAPTYVPPAERELNRGLGQSPEKASKAKTAKFTRY
ncbi:hypothetical protein K466DRAFT_608003, partial [Polyporus arcularius HHB13444]